MRSLFLVVCFCALFGAGCGRLEQSYSHLKSGVFGLKRKITLYAVDGMAIREWECDCSVEDKGGSARFVVNGKAIVVAGTFVIEEL